MLLGFIAQFGFLGAVIFITTVCLWVYTFVHALRNPALTSPNRIIWIVLLVFFNVLGAIFYCYIAPKPNEL